MKLFIEEMTMKKVLFATTALVASAGIASADITLTGEGSVALTDSGAAAAQARLVTDIDFGISASVTSDTGITFGASMDLDSGAADAGTFNDPEITMSGEFGTFSFGQVDNAAGIVGLADAGIEGIGLDDDLEAIDTVGAADIHYSNTFGNITLTLSYEMGQTGATAATDGDYGIAVALSEGGFDIKAAYTSDQDGGANDTASALQLGYTYGAATIGALFADNGTRSGSGFSLSYDMGDGLTIIAVANQTDVSTADATDTDDDTGIGFSYDMGNGVSFAGAIGSVDDNTAMDLGFGFKF
jgi:outer membrane protein OmpU